MNQLCPLTPESRESPSDRGTVALDRVLAHGTNPASDPRFDPGNQNFGSRSVASPGSQSVAGSKS